MYNIELNITGLSEALIETMKSIGSQNDFEVFHHGSDHLVFKSDRGLNFTQLINSLARVCQYYDVDYMSILV